MVLHPHFTSWRSGASLTRREIRDSASGAAENAGSTDGREHQPLLELDDYVAAETMASYEEQMRADRKWVRRAWRHVEAAARRAVGVVANGPRLGAGRAGRGASGFADVFLAVGTVTMRVAGACLHHPESSGARHTDRASPPSPAAAPAPALRLNTTTPHMSTHNHMQTRAWPRQSRRRLAPLQWPRPQRPISPKTVPFPRRSAS